MKSDVIHSSASCLNKAHDQEQLFVLLGRDSAAPVAIRSWIAERLRLGKNVPGDEQIREAFECAALMELGRSEIEVLLRQQITISTFASQGHLAPNRKALSWADFTTLFSEPRSAACSRNSCLLSSCPHRTGTCWSPALFTGEARYQQAVATIGLLAFDVDRALDVQIDQIRDRISGLRYLVHATHSDQPDRRCLRFIFPLSRPVTPDAWVAFWYSAQRSLVPLADRACSDAARVYFFPSRPHDASYFVQVNEGTVLDVDTMLAMVPTVRGPEDDGPKDVGRKNSNAISEALAP